MRRGRPSLLRRLEALEAGPRGQGVDVWQEDEDRPGIFQRAGVRLCRADVEALSGPVPALRVFVVYGEGGTV
ncbi:hypothetical protein [Deinococcus sp. YIM 77859]|uniref:hypothetical protein n=1 Tax=Deinococcus sp. YIM 77859 TaxID=1540221 RepID=UPI0012E069E1|nr:hypothetical protein [Deinococcus sp. YIM 77859]